MCQTDNPIFQQRKQTLKGYLKDLVNGRDKF